MAFYAQYADENGLTVSQVSQRVSRWDMAQWRQVLDSLRAVTIPDEATDRIKYAMATAGINRDYLMMSIIAVHLAVATAKQHALMVKRLGQDVADETNSKTKLLGLQEEKAARLKQVESMRDEIYDKYVKDSFKDASERWSPRLWQHSEEMTREVQNIVSKHITQGMDMADLTDNLFPYSNGASSSSITGQVESLDYRAQRLLRTESARAVNEVNQKVYEIVGIEEVDVVNEPGACPKCIDAVDKGPYPLKEAPSIPIHPNCRCSIVPHDDFLFIHY